jgi:hypothetical protein
MPKPMNIRFLLFSIVILFSSNLCADEEPVVVRHVPPTGKILEKGYFPNMWFYRTEVKNNTKSPLKVVWFEGYLEYHGKWRAANILGHTMRSEDFSSWYTEGANIQHGIIPPGETAVCDVNWHGSDSKEYINMKWSYILVDDKGNDYFIEKIVNPKIIKYVNYGSNY